MWCPGNKIGTSGFYCFARLYMVDWMGKGDADADGEF